jgi:hypothetical protein
LDLTTLLKILLRRWYVVVPLLSLTVFGVLYARDNVEPTFQGQAQIILTPPAITDTEAEDPDNPFLESNRALATTARALAIVINSADNNNRVREGFPGTKFTVAAVENEPILDIRTSADAPDAAIALRDKVVEEATVQLRDIQTDAGAPEQRLIGYLSVEPSRPKALFGSRDRAVVATFALGVVATVSAALLLEAFLGRRRRRAELLAEDGGAAFDEPVPASYPMPPAGGGRFSDEDLDDQVAEALREALQEPVKH